MKCLKIPNTLDFWEITSINDAMILHKKLILDGKHHVFDHTTEAETEDENGNIIKNK